MISAFAAVDVPTTSSVALPAAAAAAPQEASFLNNVPDKTQAEEQVKDAKKDLRKANDSLQTWKTRIQRAKVVVERAKRELDKRVKLPAQYVAATKKSLAAVEVAKGKYVVAKQAADKAVAVTAAKEKEIKEAKDEYERKKKEHNEAQDALSTAMPSITGSAKSASVASASLSLVEKARSGAAIALKQATTAAELAETKLRESQVELGSKKTVTRLALKKLKSEQKRMNKAKLRRKRLAAAARLLKKSVAEDRVAVEELTRKVTRLDAAVKERKKTVGVYEAAAARSLKRSESAAQAEKKAQLRLANAPKDVLAAEEAHKLALSNVAAAKANATKAKEEAKKIGSSSAAKSQFAADRAFMKAKERASRKFEKIFGAKNAVTAAETRLEAAKTESEMRLNRYNARNAIAKKAAASVEKKSAFLAELRATLLESTEKLVKDKVALKMAQKEAALSTQQLVDTARVSIAAYVDREKAAIAEFKASSAVDSAHADLATYVPAQKKAAVLVAMRDVQLGKARKGSQSAEVRTLATDANYKEAVQTEQDARVSRRNARARVAALKAALRSKQAVSYRLMTDMKKRKSKLVAAKKQAEQAAFQAAKVANNVKNLKKKYAAAKENLNKVILESKKATNKAMKKKATLVKEKEVLKQEKQKEKKTQEKNENVVVGAIASASASV